MRASLLLNEASRLRGEAERLRDSAAFLPEAGPEGDRKFLLGLQASALEYRARKLSQEGCDLIEQELDEENT